jgi:hypothetical protein
VASSAISMSSQRRSSCLPSPCSIISVRELIFVVMEDMEAERTASSSRRSAKLRERSRGRESRVWVYSLRRAREYTVDVADDGVETAARGGAIEEGEDKTCNKRIGKYGPCTCGRSLVSNSHV